MIVYMDLENLLKEKNISKNKLCEACNSLIQISHISICFQMHIALIHLL